MMHKQNILNIFHIIQTVRGKLIEHKWIINSNTFMFAGDANICAASPGQSRAGRCINIVIISTPARGEEHHCLQTTWQR